MRLYAAWLLFAVASAVVMPSYADKLQAREDALPDSLEQIAKRFQTDLEASGFEVLRGQANLFSIDDCKFAIASMGNCLGNNPAAPYVLPSVPLWADEFVDEHLQDAFGPLAGGTWATHRMDQREAVVVLALLPPPGGYFGIQTYIYSREGALDLSDPVFQGLTEPVMRDLLFSLSPNPARVLTLSSIGNSNNNVVVEQQSGAAFDQQRFFIVTPDAVMERKLTAALLRAGVPRRDDVFVEPVGAELARLGLGEQADDFMTLIRYAQPDDPAAGDAWREQLPLVVFRVRDTDASRAVEPYATPEYDQKGGVSEHELENDLQQLVAAVKQRWSQAGADQARFESLQLSVDLIGQHCLQRPMNCLGDTQDADYQISPSFTLDDGEVLAVAGTLGTATGNATYVGLSVNRVAVLQGVVNVDDDELQGSAAAYAPTVANTDQLYVQYFARDCTGLTNCQELSEELVPPGETIKLIQRDYVAPGTERGPDPNLLVQPAVVVFDGGSRPSDSGGR